MTKGNSALKLYGFFNSSASFRVRIALNLKGLQWDYAGVNIRCGDQSSLDYRKLNPVGLVPTLTHEGHTLTQSLAIIDYLDAIQPCPRLIPADTGLRGRTLEIAQLIACDIHPLNNLRVLTYLESELGCTGEQRRAWYAHWIAVGFDALESMLTEDGPFAVGTEVTVADCCLIPQVTNAMRMNVELGQWPRTLRVYEHCMGKREFHAAGPRYQPDYRAS